MSESSGGNVKRLESDYLALRKAFDIEPLVVIKTEGRAPFSKYTILYKVPSLRQNSAGQPMRVEQTVVELTLPAGYPKMSPVAKVAGGDVVFHPNFNANKICLFASWAPSIQLADLVREIGHMLQWKKYNIRDSLNAEAAEWSQRHQSEIPLSDHSLDGGGSLPDVKIN